MPEKPKDKEDAEHVKLVPEPEFEKTLKKVLATSKQESDEQLARFQASNRARREQKRPKS